MSEELIIKNKDELLFRQIHPGFVQQGRFSSQVFKVTPKDENCLSVSRGFKTDPKSCYELHIKNSYSSCGICAVTVEECNKEELNAVDDAIDENPAHAFIDYRELNRKKADAKAGILANYARTRGFLYDPAK